MISAPPPPHAEKAKVAAAMTVAVQAKISVLIDFFIHLSSDDFLFHLQFIFLQMRVICYQKLPFLPQLQRKMYLFSRERQKQHTMTYSLLPHINLFYPAKNIEAQKSPAVQFNRQGILAKQLSSRRKYDIKIKNIVLGSYSEYAAVFFRNEPHTFNAKTVICTVSF